MRSELNSDSTSQAPVMKALIADGELAARQTVRTCCQDFPRIEIIGEAMDGRTTVLAVSRLQPDLVFLDFSMPGMTGFELVEALAAAALTKPPRIVFTTNYDESAVRAFEVHAIDYLLKPYARRRFGEVLGRVLALQPDLATLARRLHQVDGRLSRILVREGSTNVPLPLEDVQWIEAAGDYAMVHTADGVHLATRPLGHLAEGLDPGRFVRVHRSAVIHINALQRLEADSSGGMIAHLAAGAAVRVSRSRAPALRARMR